MACGAVASSPPSFYSVCGCYRWSKRTAPHAPPRATARRAQRHSGTAQGAQRTARNSRAQRHSGQQQSTAPRAVAPCTLHLAPCTLHSAQRTAGVSCATWALPGRYLGAVHSGALRFAMCAEKGAAGGARSSVRVSRIAGTVANSLQFTYR